MMKRTNILNELKKVNPVITEETNFKTILGIISSESNSNNKFNFDKLDKNKIFDLESIKKICINFRLRFLDHKYFLLNIIFLSECISLIISSIVLFTKKSFL